MAPSLAFGLSHVDPRQIGRGIQSGNKYENLVHTTGLSMVRVGDQVHTAGLSMVRIGDSVHNTGLLFGGTVKTLLLLFFSLSIAHARVPIPGLEPQPGIGIDDITGIQRIEFAGGYGEKTDNFRVTAHWHLFGRTIARYDVDFSLAANYSIFNSQPKNPQGDALDMRDVGLTPVATVYLKRRFLGLRPFMEMGIGIHYLTDKRFSTKDFSTRFQFGDHIGVGVLFGRGQKIRLAYQFQHLSNAGLKNPNPGINFHILNFGVKFQK